MSWGPVVLAVPLLALLFGGCASTLNVCYDEAKAARGPPLPWRVKEKAGDAWDKPPEVVDDAITRRHGSGASHGARSAVCRFREKYVWAAVDRVAGEMADHLPAWSDEHHRWERLAIGPPTRGRLAARAGPLSAGRIELVIFQRTRSPIGSSPVAIGAEQGP